jgi:hypothetical protein
LHYLLRTPWMKGQAQDPASLTRRGLEAVRDLREWLGLPREYGQFRRLAKAGDKVLDQAAQWYAQAMEKLYEARAEGDDREE